MDFDKVNLKKTTAHVFGKNWVGPDNIYRGETRRVAHYKAQPDGREVDVMCQCLPSLAYSAEVKAGVNENGDKLPEFRLETGTGQDKLIADVAEAISEGMLVLEMGDLIRDGR